MVKQGTILTDINTGETYEFLETNQSSGGKYCKIKYNIRKGGPKPAMHMHESQDETFEVLSGYFTYEYKGEKKNLPAGESLTLPKGEPHTHYVDDSPECVVIQTLSPALDFEDMFARIMHLSNSGKIKNGQPPLLEGMVWLQKYDTKVYMADIPVGIQKGLSLVLAPVGRMLGYGGW